MRTYPNSWRELSASGRVSDDMELLEAWEKDQTPETWKRERRSNGQGPWLLAAQGPPTPKLVLALNKG